MRLLLCGRDGQLGRALLASLGDRPELCAVGRKELDLARAADVLSLLERVQPDLIVNAAAYTAVDRAESEASLAFAVNRDGPAAMAQWAERAAATLVHFSTDYVFDGAKGEPYTEDDATNPLSVYGQSKLEGEQAIRSSGAAHLIFRTSWLYAPDGVNFLTTMLRLGRTRTDLTIVDDQIGAPTSVGSIANALLEILQKLPATRDGLRRALLDQGGLYHMTCSGADSWYGFARRLFEMIPDGARTLRSIRPIPSSEYPTAATRPKNSRLSNVRLNSLWGVQLPSWEAALESVAAVYRG